MEEVHLAIYMYMFVGFCFFLKKEEPVTLEARAVILICKL